MKIRHILIIGLFILINVLILWAVFSLGKDKREEEKKSTPIPHVEAMKVSNKQEELLVSGYGTISSYNTVDIAAEIQGKLYAGVKALKPGIRFKKGDLLFRLDDVEAKYLNRARKSAFINLLANIMPDIKMDFPSEYNKWSAYMESIKLNDPLPQLPSWSSDKEKVFLSTRNILGEYFNIKSQEEQLKKFAVHAPFSGTISEVYMPEYSYVNPGTKIIRIVQTGNYEIPVSIPVSQIGLVQPGTTCTIFSTDGSKRGGGSVVRISEVINRSTQSVTVYVKPGNEASGNYIEGEYLLVQMAAEINYKGVRLPNSAIYENEVFVYSQTDSLLRKKPIQVINQNEDGIFVGGLNDGEIIVTQEVLNYNDTLKYGINLK